MAIYMWREWWTPWANTIAYYPLNGNALDYSWNWYNGTRQYWWHYATGIDWKLCWDFSRTYAEYLSSSCSTQPRTVMWFMKRCDLYATQRDRRQIIWQTSNWWTNGWCFKSKPTAYNSATIQWLFTKRNPEQNYTDTSMVDLNWHHFALTSDNSNTYLYFDGVLKKTYSGSLATSGSGLKIWKSWANTDYELNAYMQYIILESSQWTQQDIQDYLSLFTY